MLPKFICIGAQKSGTTWLYHNLKEHPQIWLPPWKELKYFDQGNRGLIHLLSNKTRRIILRDLMKKMVATAPQGQPIGWYLRYLFLPRSDAWYASLFSPNEGQIAGELTPSYALLNQVTVTHIHTLMPDLKVIYLLRNPLERMWSQVAMRVRDLRGELIDDTPPERIERLLNRKRVLRRSQYLETLQTWEAVYPLEQIFVGFYEDLKENPQQLLAEIYRFLKVDETFKPSKAEQKIHAGKHRPMPDVWARYLAEKHYEQLKLLDQRFKNRSTASWLAFAEMHLASVA